MTRCSRIGNDFSPKSKVQSPKSKVQSPKSAELLVPKRSLGTATADFGLWTLDFGLWTLDFGLWTLDFGLWTLDFGLWTLDFGLWTLDFGLWTLDFGLWTLDFGLWTLDFGLWTLDFGLWTYSGTTLTLSVGGRFGWFLLAKPWTRSCGRFPEVSRTTMKVARPFVSWLRKSVRAFPSIPRVPVSSPWPISKVPSRTTLAGSSRRRRGSWPGHRSSGWSPRPSRRAPGRSGRRPRMSRRVPPSYNPFPVGANGEAEPGLDGLLPGHRGEVHTDVGLALVVASGRRRVLHQQQDVRVVLRGILRLNVGVLARAPAPVRNLRPTPPAGWPSERLGRAWGGSASGSKSADGLRRRSGGWPVVMCSVCPEARWRTSTRPRKTWTSLVPASWTLTPNSVPRSFRTAVGVSTMKPTAGGGTLATSRPRGARTPCRAKSRSAGASRVISAPSVEDDACQAFGQPQPAGAEPGTGLGGERAAVPLARLDLGQARERGWRLRWCGTLRASRPRPIPRTSRAAAASERQGVARRPR